MALDFRMRSFILGGALFQVASCRATAPAPSETYGIVTEDESRNFFTFKEFEAVRTYANAEDCGHNASGMKILGDTNIKVYNSKAYLDAGLQDGKTKLKFANRKTIDAIFQPLSSLNSPIPSCRNVGFSMLCRLICAAGSQWQPSDAGLGSI